MFIEPIDRLLKENQMKKGYEKFFEPMHIGKMEVKNKFFMPPMATLTEVDEDYCYTAAAVEYYVQRAKGGVGMIITGANWVDNTIEPHVVCSFPTPITEPHKWTKKAKELTDRCHAYDTKMILQLTAGLGRSALPSMVNPANFSAPSKTTNRWAPNFECRELTTEEIEQLVTNFGIAAKTAKSAGFDGIEIHAVHEGYLLDCFTMSLFNQRTDKYGGSLENRLRFATEIIQEIKKSCGINFPVIMRFSIKSYIKALRQGALPGEEFKELGRDVEESLKVIRLLEDAGVDCLDSDAGTYDSWYWSHPPMYFEKGMYLPLAAQIKGTASVPVIVAGRMDNPEMALKALNDGIIDGVGLGRPLLADPNYIMKLKTGQEELIRPCLGCHDGCFGRLLEGGTGSCAVNPEVGREIYVGIKKAEEKKNIAVIGGGPAGLEAARVSAERGYTVTLFEAKEALGGALLIGGQPKFKSDDLELARYYTHELDRLGVNVRLNTKASLDAIKELNPDIIYVAEGSKPSVPPINGIEYTVFAQDVLTGKISPKENIAVIGGGLVGCELALHLAQNGSNVSIVEALSDILKSGGMLPPMNEFMLRDLLAYHKVSIYPGASVLKITESSLTYEIAGKEETLYCDQIILAAGYKPVNDTYLSLKNEFPYVYNLGDSRSVRNIRGAIWDAYEVARSL